MTIIAPDPVEDDSLQPVTTIRRAAGMVLMEAMLVAVVGITLSLAANRISPRGLELARNYFPDGTNNAVRTAAAPVPIHVATGTSSPTFSVEQLLAAQIKQEGLQLIDNRQAVSYFHESQSNHAIVFIDARDEENYQASHIPGAYEFDPYRPERYFPNVIPICQTAEEIVVYCSGGDCDDSQTAALLLKDVGISVRKLFIYGGGISEWTNRNLPVQTGPFSSGKADSTTR